MPGGVVSPGMSWLIFGGWLLAVVLIVAFFMGATRGQREYDERTFTENSVDAHVRIIAGPYDHEARGDFE